METRSHGFSNFFLTNSVDMRACDMQRHFLAQPLICLLAIRAHKHAGSGNRHLPPGSSLLCLNFREPQWPGINASAVSGLAG
jgi:hypothetical protein